MTIMSFLLLIILYLVFFLYFSGLNPQELTIYFWPGHSITHSAAIIIVGAILLGLILGYAAHLYGTVTHMLKHWRRDRQEKKAREVAAIYREGVGRLLSGDVKRAHSLLQKALERDPARVDTYIAMANVHLQEGHPQEALTLLLKARSLEPRSLEVLFKLANTYEETGQDDQAQQVYQDLLPIENDNRKALRCLRDLHIRHDRWQEAFNLQKRILKAGPGANRLEEEKRKALYLRYEVARQGIEADEADQAKGELKEITKQDPAFVPARVSLGDIYRRQKRTEDAINVWQDGYRTLGKSIFLSRLEELYLADEDPASLLALYRSFLEDRKDDLILRLCYGKLCLRLEMVDEALEQLYAVESTGVESRQLHLLLAEAHRRRKRLDDAIAEYKKALGIDSPRLTLGYVCDVCEEPSEEWQSRCPACGTWGSFSLAGREHIQNVPPLEMRPIHHGEREEWNEGGE